MVSHYERDIKLADGVAPPQQRRRFSSSLHARYFERLSLLLFHDFWPPAHRYLPRPLPRKMALHEPVPYFMQIEGPPSMIYHAIDILYRRRREADDSARGRHRAVSAALAALHARPR